MARVPSQAAPLLYLATAHVALAVACAFAAYQPDAVVGFFAHSWTAALVHLITLGWITGSIFGAFYIVGPLALRMEMRARGMDYVAYALVTAGLAGMVVSLWIREHAGTAWAAATVTCGALYMTSRILAEIRRAAVPAAVRLHIILACVNFWLAASMGVLIAVDRVAHVLPGPLFSNVIAHAHLAAIGWATMMVVGVGYRLLPMVLPSRMPSGRSLYASALLLEAGVLGLFASLLLRSVAGRLFGAMIVAGLAVFLGHVVWMLRHPAPRPAGAPRVDFAVLHAAAAGASLLAAVLLGLTLLMVPLSAQTLRAASVYGVLGLVGFLAQMVAAMEIRLLPMVTWCWAYASSGYRVPPPSPHAMRSRSLQVLGLAGWTIGVMALAAGFGFESAPLVRLGATALFAGVAAATLDHVSVLTGAFHAVRDGHSACISATADGHS
ncbi:MAG: hypothetical protein A3H29_15000 [Acidobacteria bacterium RIFCSPLOWO2_02_FULL_67_21]|nr:MAG: hypothetical protein A3H29_15000 [Acidobacteria bacterium RIFCSPLOWO2_02_FULL_67_21]